MPYRRSVFLSASEDRLQKLIAERLEPGADKQAIDRRIWDLFGEEWCVLVTDMTGLLLGAGLGFGRVLRIGDADVFGEEVNAAYILGEDTACAYEILVTKAARDAAGNSAGLRFEEISDVPPGAEKAFRVIYDG
jgi:class 3 adenylate cyclase